MSGEPIAPAAHGLLLAATATVGLGMALLAWKTTAIGSVLFMNHGIAHERTVLIERGLAWGLLGAVAALAFVRARAVAAVLILAVAVFLAWANVDQGGYPFSRFAGGAHALRMAAPLALLLAVLPWAPLAPLRRGLVVTLLLAATAVTFIVHGVEALAAHPWFTDLTIGSFRVVGGWRISQRTAESILLVVGCVDLAAVLALIIFRSPWVAGWMACWGLFTSLLRPLNYGAGAWGEFVVRLPHFLLPLALLVLFRRPSPPPPTQPINP